MGLGNISIILVEPMGAGNIGSVARAMKNTGFSDLVLINPVEYLTEEAFSMACGAKDLLYRARVFQDLDEALKDYQFIVGTTRRKGRGRYPIYPFPETVRKILDFSEENRVAILFGREDKGLKNEEIARCGILTEIPAHEDYPSYNLSHAVLLCCYQLFISTLSPAASPGRLATLEEVEGLFQHIERTLDLLGYRETGLIDPIMKNFRKLFGRTGLLRREVNMIRGICSQIEKRIKTSS